MVLFGGAGQGFDRANGIVNIVLGAQHYATVVDANGEATIPLSFGPSDVGRDIVPGLLPHRRRFGLSMSNGLRLDDPVTSGFRPPDSASGSVVPRAALPHGRAASRCLPRRRHHRSCVSS